MPPEPRTSGSMQDWPLVIPRVIDHAAANFGDREVVGATVEGGMRRSCWSEVRERSKRLARALGRLGVRQGECVATLAWNTVRHLECWYGVTGFGVILHTVNPRLFREQILYILNHAEDAVLLFDTSFLEIVEQLAPQMTGVRHFVVLTSRDHMPVSSMALLCYEELLAAEDGAFEWPALDENAPAGLCYTSGTTGRPKGVLYSHRSSVLHAMAACTAEGLGLSSRSAVMPVVPMYHANAWGAPYSAAMAGAKLVLNGPHSDPPALRRLIVEEGVTLTLAVPTVWQAMLDYLERESLGLGVLERVVIGGSAVPRATVERFRDRFGVAVTHAWGMTETSPIGSVNHGFLSDAPGQVDLCCKQGRPLFGIEMTIRDGAGAEVPRDGMSLGHLRVRGPWVLRRYFKAEDDALEDGWFDTGDIATIDPDGRMQIIDRSKDVIKSGGEWISSAELENAAIGCPGVAEAAVIGVPHPKWDERPLMLIVAQADTPLDLDVLRRHLSARVAKWWLPEEIRVVASLPHTATGKLSKVALRAAYPAS